MGILIFAFDNDDINKLVLLLKGELSYQENTKELEQQLDTINKDGAVLVNLPLSVAVLGSLNDQLDVASTLGHLEQVLLDDRTVSRALLRSVECYCVWMQQVHQSQVVLENAI